MANTAIKSKAKATATTKIKNNIKKSITNNPANNTAKISIRNIEVYDDQRFFMINGDVISRLSDLPDTISHLDDNTFSYHVNSERNDFSNWISDVILDAKLAEKVRKAKTKSEMAKVIRAAL